MNDAVTHRLVDFIDEGKMTANEDQWSAQVAAFFDAAGLSEEADRFLGLVSPEKRLVHPLRIGHLEGLLAKSDAERAVVAIAAPSVPSPVVPAAAPPGIDSRKVFVVHGHDSEAKETTARFLERIGLQPIILHEQASSGRTVIEKFENYSGDIAFAVVLLTPDDVGAAVEAKKTLNPRARQNVIMELGYFMGRLGRIRVCALHKGGVELPSDYQGVIYIAMDSSGAWKAKLAQEFVQAKLPIDLNGLLGG